MGDELTVDELNDKLRKRELAIAYMADIIGDEIFSIAEVNGIETLKEYVRELRYVRVAQIGERET